MVDKRPNNNYQVGEIYPFLVTRIYDNFCELTDADGFKVYLQNTNSLMLVRGQRIRCRVLKNYKKRPKIEIVDYDYVEGTTSKVSPSRVVELMRQTGATWDVAELATLLMTPDRGGSFDDDCQHWVAALRRAGVGLATVQHDCRRFMEESPFLALCNPVERQLYQQRLTALVEWLDCHVRADSLLREGKAAEYVGQLMAKLRLSGFVYRPVWNFNVLSCLFLADPALMEQQMPELFTVLRQWNPELWTEEPLNGVLVKVVQLYIDRNISRVDHARDNAALVSMLIQALAIQLKLMASRTDDDLYRLNLSRLSTLATYGASPNGQQILRLSLANLLATTTQQSPYSWADTASQRVPILFSQIVPQAIDTDNCYIFPKGKLTVGNQQIALELGQSDKPREALPQSLGLWGGLQVIADRNLLHPLNASPTIADCKRFWENVELSAFEQLKPTEEVQAKQQKRHHVNETVHITITRQDDNDPLLFHAEIDDEQGGQGYIYVYDIVPYSIKANITHFRWRNGHRMVFEAVITELDDDNRFHFKMLDLIKRYIVDEVMETDQEMAVSLGAELPADPRLAIPGVTKEGYSVSLYGFDETDCTGIRRGQLVTARYMGAANGPFMLKCKVTGRPDHPDNNDMQRAFLNLMETVAFEDKDDDREEFEKSDRMLDPTYLRELIRIIDRMSVLDNEYVKSYNYLGFARILCRLIDWTTQADYYRGRMELIVMLHDFAINGRVDPTRLKEFATANGNLYEGNQLLHNRFLQLQTVSFMGRDDHDRELWHTYTHHHDAVKDIASLVIAYNMLLRNNMQKQANDLQNRIKQTLRLEGYESGLKIYGSGTEDLVTEYKTSILFPPDNNMLPDLDRQMHNILAVIASFLNTDGGTLYIGVNDSGAGVGIEGDLSQPPFYGDKDKYKRTIIDAVCLTWGNSTGALLNVDFDADNTDKDVLIVTVKPSATGVIFDGQCPVRVSSTRRRLTVDEFNDLKDDRARRTPAPETATPQHLDPPAAEAQPLAPRPSSLAPKTTPSSLDTIATSRNRNNQLNDWEDDYQADHVAYIKFTEQHFTKLTTYDYDEALLTLAVHDSEQDAYLLLGYDDGSVTKVPLRELLKMDDNRRYNRYTDTPLAFATIAADQDLLVSITEEDKTRSRRMVRADHIAGIDEGKMAARGSRIYNEGMARPGVAYEVIPASQDTTTIKSLIDRDQRTLGFALKTSAQDTQQTLKRYGIE